MYKINIREEIFGGTLFNLENGKREYIDRHELSKILKNVDFPQDINVAKNIKMNDIKFTKLNKSKNINHYSFADIVFLEVTRSCNLRCRHCLNNSGDSIPNELSQKELINLIKELANKGVQDIRFTGGEPLLYKGIYELIEVASNNGVYTSIGTNGTLITKSVAKKLKNSGLNKAIVSIDGTKETHDVIRGKGNYEKTLIGLDNLMEQGIKVRVNSVIMKSNINEIIALAKELHKKKIHVFIRRFIEAGRGINLENNMLSKKDYQYVAKQLEEELKGNYVIGHYLHDSSEIISRIKLPFKMEGCKAGQRAIAIMANGDIQLCGFLYSQGVKQVNNIRNIIDWTDFWNNLQKHDILCYLRCKLDKYNSIPEIQETYCLAYIQMMMNKGEL